MTKLCGMANAKPNQLHTKALFGSLEGRGREGFGGLEYRGKW